MPKGKTKKNEIIKGSHNDTNFELIPLRDTKKYAIKINETYDFDPEQRYVNNVVLIPSYDPIGHTHNDMFAPKRITHLSGKPGANNNVDQTYRAARLNAYEWLVMKLMSEGKIKNDAKGKLLKQKLENPEGYIAVKLMNSKGQVREDDIVARFSSRGIPNTLIDWATVANVRSKPGIHQNTDPEGLTNMYSWFRRPNMYDVSDIDVPDSKYRPEVNSALKAVISGDDKDIEAFKKIVEKNFTKREQKLLNNAVIKLQETQQEGVAGYYQNAEKNKKAKDLLVIKPSRLYKEAPTNKIGDNKSDLDEDTTTHEIIHLLRERDKLRTGAQKAPPDHKADDIDYEEAMTDLETHVRATSNPKDAVAGYHSYTKGIPVEAKKAGINEKEVTKSLSTARLYDLMLAKKEWEKLKKSKDIYIPKKSKIYGKDFKLFSNVMFKYIKTGILPEKKIREKLGITSKDIEKIGEKIQKTKKGKRAVKAAEHVFPSTAISKAKIHSKADTIDTFYEYKNKGGNTVETQIYSPKGNVKKAAAIKLSSLGNKSGKLIEEIDGKKLPLKSLSIKFKKNNFNKRFRR